jgi:hypothetical protein
MQLDLEELISLQGDTHANHSVKQAGDKAKKMNVISGQKCYELSKVANHDTFWLKMLLVMSQWASTKCLLTWKIKDTPQGRLLYQLVPKTHHIDETEYGLSDNLWPTPTSGSAGQGMSPSQMKRNSLNLAQTVQVKEGLWPTPTAGDHSRNTVPPSIGKTRGYDLSMKVVEMEQKKQEQMWPTPSTRDYKGGYLGGRIKNGKISNDTLDVAVQYMDNQKKEQKQLSAKWVTWLMGYPQGYLDISTENQNTSQELLKEKKTEPKS